RSGSAIAPAVPGRLSRIGRDVAPGRAVPPPWSGSAGVWPDDQRPEGVRPAVHRDSSHDAAERLHDAAVGGPRGKLRDAELAERGARERAWRDARCGGRSGDASARARGDEEEDGRVDEEERALSRLPGFVARTRPTRWCRADGSKLTDIKGEVGL